MEIFNIYCNIQSLLSIIFMKLSHISFHQGLLNVWPCCMNDLF